MNILVINAGSSSLKYQLLNPETGVLLAKGLCERIGIDGKFTYKPQVEGKETIKAADVAMPTHSEAIQAVLNALVDKDNGVIGSMKEIDAVGHRVVHGGEAFNKSVLITDEVMKALEDCIPLAPLHNPANITGINACTAEEAELKMNETYHKPVRGYELEEMIHGPHYALDENNDPQLAGFDVALAQYVADYLGLELDIIPMDFDGVLNELATGNVDLGMAGLSPDPARADAMDFSDIYYFGGQSFVTVKDKADQFTDLASANKAEYSIGAQNGSIQYDLAVENTPDADIVSLTKVTDIIGDLLNDKLDGAFIETAVAENYAKNSPELVIVCDVPYDVAGSAIGVMKGNDSLMKGVNEAIAAALSDGSMDKFVAEANELSVGNVYEGLLDENGKVAEG